MALPEESAVYSEMPVKGLIDGGLVILTKVIVIVPTASDPVLPIVSVNTSLAAVVVGMLFE
jgi:hypothetical protein